MPPTCIIFVTNKVINVMISEESKSYIDDMAAQAADLESRCATAKPARLPKHELAYYIMDNHFRASQVLWGLAWVAVFAILEFVLV